MVALLNRSAGKNRQIDDLLESTPDVNYKFRNEYCLIRAKNMSINGSQNKDGK